MQTMKRVTFTLAAVGAVLLAVAGCASAPSSTDLDREAAAVMKASFRDQGIAKLDRLNQDLGQAACSSATPPSDAVAQQVMDQARAAVKWPAGGQYIGDWREGEKLAQNGRGMTWTDRSAAPSANGAQCYNWRSGRAGGRRDGQVHLGQAVELQGDQRLLEHAAFRAHGPARRKADRQCHGPAAGPEVAGQPVERSTPQPGTAGLFRF